MVTLKAPEIVEVPRLSASASAIVTLLPLFTATVLKLFEALLSVMSLEVPADRVVAPVTLSAPF